MYWSRLAVWLHCPVIQICVMDKKSNSVLSVLEKYKAKMSGSITYEFGSKVSLTPSSVLHLEEVPCIDRLCRDAVLKEVVGLLNMGSPSRIIFGISGSGVVHGLKCSPCIIKMFIEGLEKMMTFYVRPQDPFPLWEIILYEVFSSSHDLVKDVWIIELLLNPRQGIYYNSTTDMNYYIRDGTQLKIVEFDQFCENVIETTASRCQRDIQSFIDEVDRLEKLLSKKMDLDLVLDKVPDNCWLADCPVSCYWKKVEDNTHIGQDPA